MARVGWQRLGPIASYQEHRVGLGPGGEGEGLVTVRVWLECQQAGLVQIFRWSSDRGSDVPSDDQGPETIDALLAFELGLAHARANDQAENPSPVGSDRDDHRRTR